MACTPGRRHRGRGYGQDKVEGITCPGCAVDDHDSLSLPGATILAYDEASRLRSATISGTTTSFVYDGDGKWASKTTGGATTTYRYDSAGSFPVVLSDGTLKYVWGNGLAYATDKAGNAQAAYHTDGLGPGRALSDGTGSLLLTYQTDEFGKYVFNQGSLTQGFGFAGEQQDPDTGFAYLRARSYASALGRVLTEETVLGSRTGPLLHNRRTCSLGALTTPATCSRLTAA